MSDDTTTVDVARSDGVDDTAHDGGHGHRHLGIALALISMAQLMVVLDATIVNIALPSLKVDLGFSNADLPWVVNAYTLAFGGLLLLGGRMGDILGRRRVFMFGVVLFGVASFLGGIAQSESLLLLSRVLQGVGAAAASPNALALITTTFPAGPQRNRAMAVYAAMSGAGAAVGLILGGALTEASWRWTFFINTPIGIAVAVAALFFLGESARQKGKFDLAGAITGTVGLTSLVYGLTHAANPNKPIEAGASLWERITSSGGWESSWTWGFIGGGLALVALFLLIEARSRHALLPFRILANRTRSVSFLVMLVVLAAMFAMFYFLGIYIQTVLGYSPLKTGFAFLPFSFGIVVAAQIASTLMSRVDPRWIAGAGTLLMAFGMWGYSHIDVQSTYVTGILPWIIVQAIGMGLVFVPLTLTAVSGVAKEDSGVGSAVLNTMQQIGGAVGLATLTTVSTNAISSKFESLQPKLAEAAAQGATPDQLKQLTQQLTAIATTHGFTRAFLVAGAMILGAAAVTLFGLAIRHEDVAADSNGPVHVG
ncbi:MAG TPA: MFS transporter [Kribbellaceae bacterium]|nr:MFS transporter [Kribbellaceae bacterium]